MTAVELIAALEGSTGAMFALDRAIRDWLWEGIEPVPGIPKPYTSSLDAALTLVPEEWTAWELRSRANKTRFVAEVAKLGHVHDETTVSGWGDTPAIALCIAALKARGDTT